MDTGDEITDIVAGASAEAEVSGVSRFSVGGAVEAISQVAASGDLDAATRAVRLQVQAAKQSWEWARRLLARLEELEERRREPAAPPGEDRRRRLREAQAAPDREGGLRSWVWAYADALAAGDIDACEEIVRVPVGLLRDNQALAGLVQDGTEALGRGRWLDAMPLLRFLVSVMDYEDGARSASERAKLATFLVVVGRIELLDLQRPEQAGRSFKQAHSTAPEHGLPLAALSFLHHAAGEYGDGLAKAHRAVELSPDRHDGYVALGMCAEGQGLPEAVDHYDRAIELVWKRPEPYAALRHLRAPVPETLQHRLAEHALRNGHPQIALEAVDEAVASAESKEWGATRWLREAQLLELRSRVLEQLDQAAEAASAMRQAGERHIWADDPGSALPFLTRARDLERELGAEQAETYWLLSNALRMLGYEETPPYVNDNALHSEQMWREGIRLQPASTGPSWAFIHHAALNELLARRADANRGERLWEAVTDCERSLLRRASEAWVYAFLARCYRSLHLTGASLAAVEQSLLRDPGNDTALEERVVSLADSGRFEEALEALEPVDNRLLADAVRAFCYAKTGRAEAALKLIGDVLASSESPAPWMYQIRAEAHRELNRRADARADYELIWSRFDRRDREDQLTYAWAAFYTERYTEALRVVEPFRDDLAEQGQCLQLSGLCRLALGDPGGAEELKGGIDAAPNVSVLDDLLAYDLPLLEELLAVRPAEASLEAVVGNARRRAADRRERLRRPATAEEELAAVAARSAAGDRSWSWVGAQASLARVEREHGRWGEAGEAYRLLTRSRRFEEAETGLQQVVEELQQAADQALRDGQVERAVADCRVGLSLGARPAPQPAAVRAALHARLALGLLETADERAAAEQLARAVRWYATANGEDPGRALGELARQQLRDAGHFWTVVDGWSALIARPETDSGLRSALTIALQTLMGYLHAALDDADDDPLRFLPVVSPIVLELHETLVPADTGPTGELLGMLIPELRQRILDQLGVLVPGVRARQQADLPAGGYAMLMYEVPVLHGRVSLADRYCLLTPQTLKALGFPLEEVRVIRDPITGSLCCWLPEAQATRLAEPVRETLLSPLAFVVRHLEGVLRRHLASLLGVQEVENLIGQWMDEQDGPYRVTLALPDQPSRFRFGRLLRELLRERVPITDWRRLLDVAQGSPLADPDLDAAVRALRRRLRELLPGNQPSVHQFSLPAAWEQAIAQQGAAWRRDLVLHVPDELGGYLRLLEAHIAGQEGPAALVVRSSEARPLVRALLERNLPDLAILAADELLGDELPSSLTGAEQPTAR